MRELSEERIGLGRAGIVGFSQHARTLFAIILLVTSFSCKGRIGNEVETNETVLHQESFVDTITGMKLSNGLDVVLTNYDSLRGVIQIFDSTEVIGELILPIPDLEVKNFEVDNLEAINSGFLMAVSWGGGKNFYGRVFYFEYNNEEKALFLNGISKTKFYEGSEKREKIDMDIDPPIRIETLELLTFIAND